MEMCRTLTDYNFRNNTPLSNAKIREDIRKVTEKDSISDANNAGDIVHTQTPQFMDLGLLTINALYEGIGISNPTTRIRRPSDGAHWSEPNHVFVENTVVGVSEAKSNYYYNYKTEFQIWK